MPNFQYLATLIIVILGWPGCLIAETVGHPIILNDLVRDGDTYMGIQLLGSLSLGGNPALAGLSDLAWDEDEQRLFAVSDNGWLLQLSPHFRDGRLVQADLLENHLLLDNQNKVLRGSWRDAEGLTLEHSANGIHGDTTLLISFERHHRIQRYTPQGRWLATIPLPKLLNQPAFRPKGNKGLEALTSHPRLGLLTGPEYPPKGTAPFLVNAKGALWFYKPKEPAGALVALEALPNGDLLLLERAYTSLFSPWVISLTRIREKELNQHVGETVPTELLARFDSGEGWLVQNMEGLTRHRGMNFFMVSDDNNLPWVQTQLLYFRVMDK